MPAISLESGTTCVKKYNFEEHTTLFLRRRRLGQARIAWKGRPKYIVMDQPVLEKDLYEKKSSILDGGAYQHEETKVKNDVVELESSTIASPKQEPTSRKEILAYYSYGIANNGLGLFNFAPTAFQNLLSIAAGEEGKLMFMGQMRTVNAIVLLANGVTCAINVALFLAIGSMADFGTWRPWILITWTIIALGISLAWLGVHDADKWHAATALYMVGLLVYQMCLSFWQAAFPGLARNSPKMKELSSQLSDGVIDRDTYEHADMMERNRISNVSFQVQSFAEIIELAIIVGIMFAVNVNASQDANNRGLSILIAFAGGVWILVALPWFIFEKRRPGMPIPAGTNVVSIAFIQLYTAAKEILQLKQSLLYLVGETFPSQKDMH